MDTSNIVQNIVFGNYDAAKETINHILLSKTAAHLDNMKKEIAQNLYNSNMNEEAESEEAEESEDPGVQEDEENDEDSDESADVEDESEEEDEE